MTELRLELINDQAALLAIGAEWDALVQRAGVEHPFLGHSWVSTWWECFGVGKELYVLAVRSGERLIGLAPLMRTRVRMYGIRVWRLEFIANVHTPRFDFIVAERFEEVYAAILDHLETREPRWDIVMLPELAESSRTPRVLALLAASRSLHSGVWVAGASPRIPLVGSFEKFCAALSAKHMSSLRRRLRRLQQVGAVSMEVVCGDEQVASALEDGLRIEAASWKGQAGTAITLHEDLKRFYALIAERTSRSGALRLLFLKAGDKRIAFGYCLLHGSTLYLLKCGYDPEYATHSPFNALMLFAIEASFRDGLETFDLLGCEEPWKRAWTDDRIERRWLFLHRNGFRALFVYVMKFFVLPLLRGRRIYPARTDKQQLSPQAEAKVVGAES